MFICMSLLNRVGKQRKVSAFFIVAIFFYSSKIKIQRHERKKTTHCVYFQGAALKTGDDYSDQAPLQIGGADYGGLANRETKSATEVPRSTKASVDQLGNAGDEGWFSLFSSFSQKHIF